MFWNKYREVNIQVKEVAHKESFFLIVQIYHLCHFSVYNSLILSTFPLYNHDYYPYLGLFIIWVFYIVIEITDIIENMFRFVEMLRTFKAFDILIYVKINFDICSFCYFRY